jgi:hypothetical protein
MYEKIFVFCSMVAVATTIVGCTTAESRQRRETLRHRQYLDEQARTTTVGPSDGISEEEAYKIGRERFETYQNGCGIVATPVDLGGYWRVTTCPGYAGIPFEDILIRKSDGLTTITKAKLSEAPDKYTEQSPQ